MYGDQTLHIEGGLTVFCRTGFHGRKINIEKIRIVVLYPTSNIRLNINVSRQIYSIPSSIFLLILRAQPSEEP